MGGLRTVGVRLIADVSAYLSGMKRAGMATKDLVGQMDKTAQKGKLDTVADNAGMAGIALTAMAGFAIKSAADFDKSMSKVKAATHASADEIKQLREAALQAGKDTQYSATGAADAITELSKAGVSTADVLNGGLKGALSLAAAGQLDVGEAAETAASAMTQFKLKGKDIPHIADLLAAGAGKAQGSVHDMGQALNQSGLVASQFGLSIEDTTGVLAEFANAGLIGSDAGTSFKTMLLALANPSGVTAKKMQELGISFYDAQGKFIGLGGVATELQDKLGQLTEEERNAALGQIFGNDAIRAATILYKDGAKGVAEWRSKVNDAGYAAQTAGDLTDNLAGDIERLKGSIETLAIEAGSGANGGMRMLVKGLGALVDELDKMPTGISQALVVLAGIGGAGGLALAAFIKLRSAVATAVEQLNAMGPAGEKAAGKLGTVASVAAKAAVALAALEVVGAVADHFGTAAIKVEQLADALLNFSNTGKVSGELADKFGTDLGDLGKNIQTADAASHGFWKGLNDLVSGIPGVSSVVDTLNEKIYGLSFNQAKENTAALDEALTSFMTTANDAATAQKMWERVVSESGIPIDHLIELLPNAYKKVGELNTAADKSGSSMGGLAKASDIAAGGLKKVAGAADSASGQALALSKSIDALFQDQMSADRAAIKLAQSTNDLTDELSKGSRTLKINSEEGRRNRGAVLDQIEAIESMRDARVRGGMALEEANRLYAKDIDGLKKTATQAGFSKTAVNKLVDAYKGIPSKVNTKVSIEGVGKVNAALDPLLVKQYALAKGMTFAAASASVQKDLDRNKQKGYHAGGWTGPGGKYDEAGTVHADEFVIRKESRRKIEAKAPGMLDEMNATGQVPGYASGGRVWPFPVNVSGTRIPSWTEVASKVAGDFGAWPSSPGAQRGDSGVWRKILALVKASGIPHEFGNAYRPGDPLWHGCVPMDTRILTRRGWLTYDELVVGEDETIGYNPATGKNEWTLIVGLHHYEDAELWTLQNSWFTTEVTPGHKWLVDQQVSVQTETICTECGRQFATGRGMTTHRGHVHGVYTPRRVRYEEQLVATRDFQQNTRIHLAKPADLGDHLPISDDEAELIGWIFADGYLEEFGPTIVQSRPDWVQYLRGFMAGFPCSEHTRPPEGRQNHVVHRWRLTHEFWDDLASRSKASKDDALNFVFSLSVSQRAAFLRGFLSADGTRDPRTADERFGFAAFQVSGPVAEAIKVAAYLEGYRPDTRVKTEFDPGHFGAQPIEHIGFRTSIVKGRHLPVVAKRTADVWCPTTTLGTWTARQGEEIFLTGNSGRAVDFMGYNQDRLARFFLARQNQVLELIHRTKTHDYGITRGHYNAMPHQWPLHRNHLHVAMKNGGSITEPIMGVGQSGTTYSFGENYQTERVVPNWQGAGSSAGGGSVTNLNLTVNAPVGSHPREIGRQVIGVIGSYLEAGGELRLSNGTKVL